MFKFRYKISSQLVKKKLSYSIKQNQIFVIKRIICNNNFKLKKIT